MAVRDRNENVKKSDLGPNVAHSAGDGRTGEGGDGTVGETSGNK